MKTSFLLGSVAACFCLFLATSLLAAQTSTNGDAAQPPPGQKNASVTRPAEKCLSDLRAFDSQMGKDGYWLGGAGYAYGYPIDGPEYGHPNPIGGRSATTTTNPQNLPRGYQSQVLDARPGYDNGGVPEVDVPAWRQNQIAAAQPIKSQDTSFRSDELLGADVFNPQNIVLGSVNDLVTNPQTRKIAYLVIGRGGIFGIDEKYVPIPWGDFKATPNVTLLVLDTTKSDMDAAPQVSDGQFATPNDFSQQSQKVDAYWKTRVSNKIEN